MFDFRCHLNYVPIGITNSYFYDVMFLSCDLAFRSNYWNFIYVTEVTQRTVVVAMSPKSTSDDVARLQRVSKAI